MRQLTQLLFCWHICIIFAYFSQDNLPNSLELKIWCLPLLFFLIVSTNKALRAKTKALQCGISALNIMTLRGCSSSYREGLFLVCSHMKCHLEFDKIWRNNPLWEHHWTAHFLILFSCYNQALSGDPCHCVIKLIIFRKNYCWHCCLEVKITGSLLILLYRLDDVSGLEFAHRCNRAFTVLPLPHFGFNLPALFKGK